jgi:hypothetical protein
VICLPFIYRIGGFINSCYRESKGTLDVRAIQDDKGNTRQVFVASRRIEPFEEHLYPYSYHKEAGGWMTGGQDEPIPRDFSLCIAHLRQEWSRQEKAWPCKSKLGADMATQSEYSQAVPCLHCQEPMLPDLLRREAAMLTDFSFTLVKAAFDVMQTGEKLHEFRENTEYWQARLLEGDDFKKFNHLTFINGMQKDSPRFKARHVSTCYVDSVNERYSNGFVLHKPHKPNGYFCITFELIE